MPFKFRYDEACNIRRQNITRSISIGWVILFRPFLEKECKNISLLESHQNVIRNEKLITEKLRGNR